MLAKSAMVMLIFLAGIGRNHGIPKTIKIGAIFHKDEQEHIKALTDALEQLKNEYTAPTFDLQPIIKLIDVSTDSFSAYIAACDLISEGVAAIFGPSNPITRDIVSSIAARFDVPHIEFAFRRMEDSSLPPTSLNAYPDGYAISQAIADMVQMMNWKSFTAIYETEDGLSRIQNALSLHGPLDLPVTLRQLTEGSDYRPLLKDIASFLAGGILLDVSAERTADVLSQAKEVKLLNDYYSYVITYLDSTMLPIVKPLNGTSANITGFKLSTSNYNDYTRVESAILFDVVKFFGFTLDVLNRRTDGIEGFQIEPVPLSCETEEKYMAGTNITNLMRELSKVGTTGTGGTTGTMVFDDNGRRSFEPRVVEFQRNKYVETAIWNQEKGIYTTRSEEQRETELRESLERKVFKVTTREGAPFFFQVKDGSNRGVLIDGVRWEGYCHDLIDAIAKLLGFKYEFELIPLIGYGSYNEETKSWDGLIRRLLDRKADLAICDLTITFARKKAVDFTMPFMNLGISILYAKPEERDPDLFSFLSPFSVEVWICTATMYLVVSLMIYFQSRFSPGEWVNPHPCNPPTELENTFGVLNSVWLTMGSLMQQGSDILPRTPALRIVTGVYWFFVLIMAASYTANLASFLTAAKLEGSINDVNDLAKQTKVKYGAVSGGSTLAFFKNSNNSVYQRMYTMMIDARPNVFTSTNNEGVERVQKGKRQYAFMMESVQIEYQVERNCDLMQVGGLLDNKGYGIAMPLNSPYRTVISMAVLKLQETGVLEQLKDKWWKKMHGGGTCPSDSGSESDSMELGIAAVGGVFLVLGFGCLFAFLIGIIEFLWNVRAVAIEEKITPWEALKGELKFVVDIRKDKKPIKVNKSSSASSSSEGGFARAASAARSISRSFLRLDILDKIDNENDTNNRNNGYKLN